MSIRELSDKGPSGTRLGQSAADLVSFHGASPVAQHAIVSNVSGSLGDVNAAVLLVISLLKLKGLMASA
jgi:hypothetical protein